MQEVTDSSSVVPTTEPCILLRELVSWTICGVFVYYGGAPLVINKRPKFSQKRFRRKIFCERGEAGIKAWRRPKGSLPRKFSCLDDERMWRNRQTLVAAGYALSPSRTRKGQVRSAAAPLPEKSRYAIFFGNPVKRSPTLWGKKRGRSANNSATYADVAEQADALDLESNGRPCKFKSCHPHQRGRRPSERRPR